MLSQSIIPFGRVYYSQIKLFFLHLKLEIALAIPASNEWKILTHDLAGETLVIVDIFIFMGIVVALCSLPKAWLCMSSEIIQ